MKFKYEIDQRVFVPGNSKVQGWIDEKRKSKRTGNSYIVRWFDTATMDFAEDVFSEEKIRKAQPILEFETVEKKAAKKKSRR